MVTISLLPIYTHWTTEGERAREKKENKNEETTARLRSFFLYISVLFYLRKDFHSAVSSAVFNSMREEDKEQLHSHSLRCSIFADKSILDHSFRLVSMRVNWMWQWLMVSINIQEGRCLNIVWWDRKWNGEEEEEAEQLNEVEVPVISSDR